MRFSDFLRVAVLLFGGAATALAVIAIASAGSADDAALLIFAVSWWAVATIGGLWLGRRNVPTAQIGRLLADARATNTLPEVEPGTIVFNRLWPLAVFAILSGAVAFLIPQMPAVAAGYALGVALTWRRQPSAVVAIEERDGVRFYFDRSSPFGAPKLLRTPGLKRIEPAEGQPSSSSSAPTT
jgi:hypothetical protein